MEKLKGMSVKTFIAIGVIFIVTGICLMVYEINYNMDSAINYGKHSIALCITGLGVIILSVFRVIIRRLF